MGSYSGLVMGFIIALCFSAWPFAGRYSGASGPWVVSICLGTTAIMSIVLSMTRGEFSGTPGGLKAVALLVGAGLINGVGTYLYAKGATNPEIPTATFVVSVTVSMCIVAPLVGAILLKQQPSGRQLLGYLFAVVAVLLLGGK